MATNKVALYNLRSGMVLDRSVFVGETSAEMVLTIEAIRANPGKCLTVIDKSSTFFTSENMIALIKANDVEYRLIAEQAGVELSVEDVDAIQRAERARLSILEKMTPPIPPYPFAEVPDGWSIATDLTITAGDRSTVRRSRHNTDGDGISHSMSVKQLKKLWGIASRRWTDDVSVSRYVGVAAGGYTRNSEIEGTRVTIGCQKVRRYELEQLAVHFGWDFPKAK